MQAWATIVPMLELFPDSAVVAEGELRLGGVPVTALADEHGTPLVVLCEQTLRARARAYRAAAPDALIAYGTKALPNVGVLRVLAEEGLGADVSTLGELRFALEAGLGGERIVVHGNNKSDAELEAAARAGALVVLDAQDELDRARAAGVERTLVRVTVGVEADTHASIRTGHRGSKFGLPPDQASRAIAAARPLGVHVHIGSQLVDVGAAERTITELASLVAAWRRELDWTPAIVDLGGGLGVRTTDADPAPPPIAVFVGALRAAVARTWAAHDLREPGLVLEPGRSIVGPAGVTLYRVGSVKHASEETAWVAIDGGMSDNPRPQLYGARYEAVLANRPSEPAAARFGVAGKHCESGDVLATGVPLPEPRRGDVLAVPATGAYTLAMASNYNGVPRPAAVLVGGGASRVVRRRETVEDLLAWET